MPHTISGHVIDKERAPVAGVKISFAGTHIGDTVADGSFSVSIPKPGDRIVLTYSADGYVTNTRVYDRKKDGGGTVVVVWPIAHSLTFDSQRELDVAFGKSRIRVPANALADDKGTPFAGPAVLQFTLLDVTQRLQRFAAPGDFSGRLDKDGKVKRLNSYGIFDFAVSSALDGRPLDLAPGISAGLSIAIPKKLVPHIPKRMPYFDFDVLEGIWIQAGSFGFNPETLTCDGTIQRFGGAHNLDDPQDTTCVTVQVVSAWNNMPMPNMTVQAFGLQYTYTGTSNANGYCCLLVQRNASFTVSAHGYIGTSYWTTIPQQEPTFTSPDFSSGAGDCGDPVRCPLLGQVAVDLVVGLPE